MAPQRVLKSLNKGPGKKRFVFKSFAQRVDDVDVDVFRSLTPIKFEPTSGSSFFHENLLRWRELNVAADFNAVFVELLPEVQTLPQLLFHKDKVMKSLLQRVRLDALLSLEPILSLIAILSRDLREEFLPYMSQYLDACCNLLKSGGDQEPDLLELVFVSISYVFKYLTKFLAKDIPFVLRVSKSLRWYHRPFVQDFVAESVSYLLRKAPPRQLIIGVRRLFAEVEADFSETRVLGCCKLLFHFLKGPAFGLHSNAEALLHLLFDKSILSGFQRAKRGNDEDVAVRVVSKTFLLLCEHIKREKLDTLWTCLIDHINLELGNSSANASERAHVAPIKDFIEPSVQDERLASSEELTGDTTRETAPVEDSTQPLAHDESLACSGELTGDTTRVTALLIVHGSSLNGISGPGPPHEPHVDNTELGKEAQAGRSYAHIIRLLSLLTDMLEFRNGSRVNDYAPLFSLIPRLLAPDFLAVQQTNESSGSLGPLAPSRLFEDWGSTICMEVFRFVLAVIKSHGQVAGASGGPGVIATVSSTWAEAFSCKRGHCLLRFLRGLVEQNVSLVQIFAPQILRSLDRLAEDDLVDVLPIFLNISEKVGMLPLQKMIANTGRLTSNVVHVIETSVNILQRASLQQEYCDDEKYLDSLARDPAVVWMALKCFPYIEAEGNSKAFISWNYVVAIDRMISADSELEGPKACEAGLRVVWECLLATALASYNKISQQGGQELGVQPAAKYLELAGQYNGSPHVLEAVSEGLDVLPESKLPPLATTSVSSILNLTNLGHNLSAKSKTLRTATLRILAFYEGLEMTGQDDQNPLKRRKGSNGQGNQHVRPARYEAFKQLFAVESAALTHENFRQFSLLLTAVKVAACTRKVPEFYVVPIFHAFIGLLRNRFSLLWDVLIDGLAGMLDAYGMMVGEVLLSHLEMTQNAFLYQSNDEEEEPPAEDLRCETGDLWAQFNLYLNDKYEGTQSASLLILLLQVLQKSASFSEARSRQLIPLFLTFVGHSNSPAEDDEEGVVRVGKDWKAVVKEWLNLIRGMRNARSLFKGQLVKETLRSRFLSDRDPAIQQVTLESLLNWKDKFLTLHEEHLKNLLSSKTLREELTTWNVTKESHLIQDEDRDQLLQVVLLILFPRIMRRTVKSMKKSGAAVQRSAILSFLARLESNELAPLFIQLMKPLESAFYPFAQASGQHKIAMAGWDSNLVEGVNSHFIEQVYRSSVAAIPFKRKLGFLHVVMDSLEIFNGVQLTPYLHAFLAVMLRILETCSIAAEEDLSPGFSSNPSQDGFQEMIETRPHPNEGNVSIAFEHAAVSFVEEIKLPVPSTSSKEISEQVTPEQPDSPLRGAVPTDREITMEVEQDGEEKSQIETRDVEPPEQPDFTPRDAVPSDRETAMEAEQDGDEKSQIETGDAGIPEQPDFTPRDAVPSDREIAMELEKDGNENPRIETGDAGPAASTDQIKPLLTDAERQLEPERENRLSQDVINNSKARGSREIRTLCFRVFATVIRKFETVELSSLYWDIFFNSIQPSISRFAVENSAAAAPTALMQCFLAMSQRVDCALLLTRDPGLVPAILSILSSKGASAEVLASVISFIENIFALEEETDADAETTDFVKVILVPHLEILLQNFRASLSSRRESAKEKRSLKRELRILTKLSKYIEDSAVAAKLQDVLLPMLKVKRRIDQDLCLEVLCLLKAVAPILEPTAIIKCLPVLASLLVQINIQDVRAAISEILLALGKADHRLMDIGELITDLNSMSRTTVGEPDFERRLQAYGRISDSLFVRLTHAQALVLLSHVIYDMGSDDMSIRHSASDCLQKYVRCAAASLLHAHESDGVTVEPDESGVGMDGAAEEALRNDDLIKCDSKGSKTLVSTLVLRHVRNGIGSEAAVVRREWVLLLREMSAHFVSDPSLREYDCLISKDVEVDFFHNIGHLQVHRRIRAMAKFKGFCIGGHFSQGALSRVFIPLFMNSIIEARGDKEGNLVTVAVETIGCIASQLRWEPYCGLLMQSLRLIAAKPDRQKVLVRLVCGILDAFHFFVPVAGRESETNDDDAKGESILKRDSATLEGVGVSEGQRTENGDLHPPENDADKKLADHSEKSNVSTRSDGQGINDSQEGHVREDETLVRELPPDVRVVLQKRVLPEIRNLMVSKEGIVSNPVSLTLVKILLLMPEAVVEVELPQVIQTIINALRSRSQGVRDEARGALVAVVETLGAKYLHFVVDVLQSSLTKGYELHVLGYTLNSILVRLVPKLEVGEIDYCLEQLLDVLENDIVGEVAEEKDVEAIAVKMKETRHMRSFESMRLLAQVVTFSSKIMVLLDPVRRNLQNALAPKVKPKLQNILQHIAQGLLHNKSVKRADLFVIVYALVEDGVKEEQAAVSMSSAKKQAKSLGVLSTPAASQMSAEKTFYAQSHLITEFALQLLHSHLRRVTHHSEDTLAMLNPLVELLRECLASKYDGVLALALKNFGLLLLLPLPAVELHGNEITDHLFSISQRFVKAENSLLQACLSVLNTLIRQCKSLKLSNDQLHALLELPVFTDLEAGSRMALSLLKSIVGRKLLVPELYDMMKRVEQLMVTSYAPAVRQICSQVLLQFLLDYPLGKKRLQQHLHFIISNVGYAETSGREAALEMLHTVILKFPDAVVEEHADSMFFPLVARLVNDDTNQVRSMIGTILKVLMGRVGHQSLQRMFEFALSWYTRADQRLWRTAAQVLGFLVEVISNVAEKYMQPIFRRCIEILEQETSPEGLKLGDEEKPDHWQDAYFSLAMMEKLMQKSHELISLRDLERFWMLVSSLLLHQHVWIRNVSGRLLSLYFSACGAPSRKKLEAVALGNERTLLLHPSWILFLVASLCRQLDSGVIDEPMAEQLVKLLETTCTLLTLLPEKVPRESVGTSFLGCDDAESDDRITRALDHLGRKGRAQNGVLLVDEIDGTTCMIENDAGQALLSTAALGEGNAAVLALVFRKLQSVALRVNPSQTKVVLQWYARMALVLGASDIEKHLSSMLIVLIKITEGSAAKVVPENVKALGEEVLNQLRELVGTAKFVNSYNAVREKGKEKRERRRQSQKVAVVTDPELHAKRKIRLTAKRQAQKRRRITEEKISRGL